MIFTLILLSLSWTLPWKHTENGKIMITESGRAVVHFHKIFKKIPTCTIQGKFPATVAYTSREWVEVKGQPDDLIIYNCQ